MNFCFSYRSGLEAWDGSFGGKWGRLGLMRVARGCGSGFRGLAGCGGVRAGKVEVHGLIVARGVLWEQVRPRGMRAGEAQYRAVTYDPSCFWGRQAKRLPSQGRPPLGTVTASGQTGRRHARCPWPDSKSAWRSERPAAGVWVVSAGRHAGPVSNPVGREAPGGICTLRSRREVFQESANPKPPQSQV